MSKGCLAVLGVWSLTCVHERNWDGTCCAIAACLDRDRMRAGML